MNYNIYLKQLGMTRWEYWKLKYQFLVPYQLHEKIKYGTTHHEMWRLPIILACELYPRLKRLREEYDHVLSFDRDEHGKHFIEIRNDLEFNTDEWHNEYQKFHNGNFDKAIAALENIIKEYVGFECEIEHDTLEAQEEQRKGMALIGWNFGGLGI